MQPEIGPLKTFGAMFAFGFLAAGWVIARRLRETGRPVDWSYELVGAALVGGVLGARLAWALEEPGERFAPGELLGTTGLVWYGGAIGGAIGVVLWAKLRGALGTWIFDICAVPLALGYAIGRVGCQLSGDGDYGEPWDGPWAMAYPDGTVPTETPVHPTPIYEALAMGLAAWGLWRVRDRVKPGGLFALYLLAAGIERVLVELLRRNEPVVAGLTLPQLQSLALIVLGIALLVRLGGPFDRQRTGALKPAG